MRFSRREAGGDWSPPRDIAIGADWFVNWADFPSLAVSEDGTLFAHWLQMSGEGVYSYDVRVAWSKDGGQTWSDPVTPHDDGTKTEHGFVSMVPASGDRVELVWLDGREMAASADGHGDGHGAGGQMTLRYGILDSSGDVSQPGLLDGRVCDCCQTSAVRTSGRLVVAYRDRSETEVRDISYVRATDAGWTPPAALGEDGWQINGCPVNGPSLAAAGERVVAAWFSAADNEPRVRAAFSSDAAASWDEPVRIDDGRPIGRVDVVLLEDGDALVSWMEQVGDGAELRVRTLSPDGRRGDAFTVAGSSAARSSGFPRMQRAGDELLIAWRDSGEPPVVRTALLERTP